MSYFCQKSHELLLTILDVSRLRLLTGQCCPTCSGQNSSVVIHPCLVLRFQRSSTVQRLHRKLINIGSDVSTCLFAIFKQHYSLDSIRASSSKPVCCLLLRPGFIARRAPPIGLLIRRLNGHLKLGRGVDAIQFIRVVAGAIDGTTRVLGHRCTRCRVADGRSTTDSSRCRAPELKELNLSLNLLTTVPRNLSAFAPNLEILNLGYIYISR